MGGVPSNLEKNCDDDYMTSTSAHQLSTEFECLRYYNYDHSASNAKQLEDLGFLRCDQVALLRKPTVEYLMKGLTSTLGPSYTSLAASRPWLVYWMLHALELLDAFPTDQVDNIRETLSHCMEEQGSK